jgi:diacylglycerol kinase (ATP)
MSALSPRARLASLSHAIAGLVALVRTQANARLHLAATVAVFVLGVAVQISPWEWISLVLSITIVWMAEALNTAIEFACDVVTREFHPSIKAAKDIAAGAVLAAASGAAVVGAIVFLPHIWPLLAP